MTALYIAAAILALSALLLLQKIKINLSYVNDLTVSVKVAFVRLTVYPIKEKGEKPVKKAAKRQKTEKAKRARPDLRKTVAVIKDTVIELLRKFKKYIRVEKYSLKILVATPDAAKTALLYGAVSATAGVTLAAVVSHKNKTRKKENIISKVESDFIGEEFEVAVDIILSIRVWQALSAAVTGGMGLLELKKENKSEANKNGI